MASWNLLYLVGMYVFLFHLLLVTVGDCYTVSDISVLVVSNILHQPLA